MDCGGIGGGMKRKRVHDIVIPFGFVFLAAFVFFSVWGWASVGPAREWRQGACAQSAPLTASCRSTGTATVTGAFVHADENDPDGTAYGVTYTGHGRIPDYSVVYRWGSTASGMVPIPKKDQIIGVTTWQGRPVFLSFSGLTVTVSTPPDKDTLLVTGFMAVAALAAVCTALIGRPSPQSRKALLALKVVDWIWLPLLVAGFVLVSVHVYELGLAAIEAGGGIAFFVSQALRVRLVFATRRGWPSVGDDASTPPPPGAQAERENRPASASRRGCPLTESDQHWVESQLVTLAERFHLLLAQQPMTVPRKGFYPMDYSTETLMVQELARKMCASMDVDFESIRLLPAGEPQDRAPDTEETGEPYAGHYSERTYDPGTGLFAMTLGPELGSEPALLTAVIAHELGHIRLREEAAPSLARWRLEQRVDLLVIALGLGLFGANVSFTRPGRLAGPATSLGGLSPQMYGYALACMAWLRDEHDPAWASSLSTQVREQFSRSLRYLSEHAGGGGLPTLVEFLP